MDVFFFLRPKLARAASERTRVPGSDAPQLATAPPARCHLSLHGSQLRESAAGEPSKRRALKALSRRRPRLESRRSRCCCPPLRLLRARVSGIRSSLKAKDRLTILPRACSPRPETASLGPQAARRGGCTIDPKGKRKPGKLSQSGVCFTCSSLSLLLGLCIRHAC